MNAGVTQQLFDVESHEWRRSTVLNKKDQLGILQRQHLMPRKKEVFSVANNVEEARETE